MQPKLVTVRAAAVATIVVGVAALCGWWLGIEILKSALPGRVTMKPNTAIGIILCGLGLLTIGRADLLSRIVSIASAGMAAILGGIVWMQYSSGSLRSLDQILFAEPSGTVDTFLPGRMALSSAIALVLLGVALLVGRIPRFQRVAAFFAAVVAALALIALTSHLYRAQSDAGEPMMTRMAFNTAVSFIIAAGGTILFVFYQRPLGPAMVRTRLFGRMLAAVILIPLALGWLRVQGERAGFYSAGFGIVLMVTATITLLSLLVWWNARSLARLEARRAIAEQALRTSERRNRLIIESANDAFIAMDGEGLVTDWNPRAEKMFGYLRKEALGRPLAELIIPERYREMHRQGLKRFLASGQGPVVGRPIEIEALHADGHEFPVELSIWPMAWGETWIFNAFIHDIAERKERDALTAASAAKDHFIAILSHELRTPLTPVMATILDLESQAELAPPVREAVQLIRRNVELEARLIDDLLDVTRLAKGKLQIERGVVDLHEVLRSAIDVCRSETLKRKVEIEFQPKASRPTVEGDAPRLLQVFWNLLQNAVKFSPPGSHVAVRTLDPEPGVLAVEIEDRGIGMSEEVISRIFNPFEQADISISRRYGGLGLGLALTKALVEAHGGRIEAESAGPDRGTLMKVQFQTVSNLAAPAPEKLAASDAAVASLRVLVVEDHSDTRRTLERLLRKWGHEVTSAEDLAGARAQLAARDFDLLLTDLGLPDGHGAELMDEIRGKESPPVAIALSGFGTEHDTQRSMEAGFAAHFTKPVGMHSLKGKIAEIVRRDAASSSS